MLIYLQLKSAHKDLSVLIRRSVKWYCGENMGLGCLTGLKSMLALVDSGYQMCKMGIMQRD